MRTTGSIRLDPSLAYEVVLAALDVVGSVSPAVHKRIARAYDTNTPTSYPVVSAGALVELRRALNKIEPGNLAEQVIVKSAEDRAKRKADMAEQGRQRARQAAYVSAPDYEVD